MSVKNITYIFCKDYSEFLQLQKDDDIQYEYIVDENFLRGRVPGVIVEYGNPEERWNYQPILESIETHKEIWEQEESKKEESDESLRYGIE